MALIDRLTKGAKRHKVHKRTDADYDTFINNGKKYLQIDTFGSEDNQIPGKVSQSIQIDEETARQLVDILKREFGI